MLTLINYSALKWWFCYFLPEVAWLLTHFTLHPPPPPPPPPPRMLHENLRKHLSLWGMTHSAQESPLTTESPFEAALAVGIIHRDLIVYTNICVCLSVCAPLEASIHQRSSGYRRVLLAKYHLHDLFLFVLLRRHRSQRSCWMTPVSHLSLSSLSVWMKGVLMNPNHLLHNLPVLSSVPWWQTHCGTLECF